MNYAMKEQTGTSQVVRGSKAIPQRELMNINKNTEMWNTIKILSTADHDLLRRPTNTSAARK